MITLSTLPEELLVQIITHIHNRTSFTPHGPHTCPDTPTLHALCLTSRTFSRIAQPFLYSSIHSTSGSMGHSLYRTLQADTASNLRKHVRELSIAHTQSGCQEVDETQSVSDAGYGRTYDVCQALFQRTIELLPNLELVDLSSFHNKGDCTWLNTLHDLYNNSKGTLWYATTPWAKVKSMAVHLGAVGAEDLWVLFRLPCLKELEVDARRKPVIMGRAGSRNLERWPIGVSPIETFRLIGLGGTHVASMSNACKTLRSVFVATEDILQVGYVPWTFKKHIRNGTLHTLQLAVVGLWYYEVVVMSIGEGDTHCRALGKEVRDLLIHATGNHGVNAEVWSDSGLLKVREMRELTEEEKDAYSTRPSTRS
jgi:hypothetical protein